MLKTGNVKINTYWIDLKHELTYEVVGFWNEVDYSSGKLYRVCLLQNIVTGNTVGVAENVVEKKYKLDSFSERKVG